MNAPRAPEWEDPRRVLARHTLAPKRSFSQNFLVARGVVEKIADAVELAPGDTVLELGAGLGTLTSALLRRGAHVVAIERDRDMLRVLEAELGATGMVEILAADAAAIDYASFAARAPESRGRIAVAGNLPYAATGAILRSLVGARASISRAVLMMQREVRDRLLAPPGTRAYGALTVFTRAAFEIQPVLLVRAGAFHPPPKVSSAVVRLVPRATPLAEESDSFRTVVRAAFETRRKTLRNALLVSAGASAERADSALSRAGIDGSRRGETLGIEDFDALARAWAEIGPAPRSS